MKPEEALQRAVVQLLALYEARGLLAFCHVGNGGYRTPAEAGTLRAMGVRPGVPDLLVWTPFGRNFGIELKAGRGARLSAEQMFWHAALAALGHCVHVCRSVDEVETVLRAEGVPAVGQIAARSAPDAVKPLAAVPNQPEDKTHQEPLAAHLRGIP